MRTSKSVKDLLIPGAAAVAVLGCGAYLAFGVAAAVAADQQGTAIRYDEPISLGMLWHEMSRISFKAVVAWLPQGAGGGVLLVLSVALALAAVALTLAVNPRICSRGTSATAGLGIGMGLLFVFGFFGLLHVLGTLLNVFALGGLDGEWILELGPAIDVIGILYLVTALLFRRSLALAEA